MSFSTLSPIPTLREFSNQEVRAYFEWFMQIMPSRLAELPELVKKSRGDWQADMSRASLEQLGEWFSTRVTTRRRTPSEIADIASRGPYPVDVPDYELSSTTFSVAHDVGFYLAESLRAKHPALHWQQVDGDKKNVLFGHASLFGFRGTSLSPVHVAITLAYGIAAGTRSGRNLIDIFDAWSRLAATSPA